MELANGSTVVSLLGRLRSVDRGAEQIVQQTLVRNATGAVVSLPNPEVDFEKYHRIAGE